MIFLPKQRTGCKLHEKGHNRALEKGNRAMCPAKLFYQKHCHVNAEIVKINGKMRFKPQKLVIYPADKC